MVLGPNARCGEPCSYTRGFLGRLKRLPLALPQRSAQAPSAAFAVRRGRRAAFSDVSWGVRTVVRAIVAIGALVGSDAAAAPQISTSLTIGGGIREGKLSPSAVTSGGGADVSRETLRAAFHMGVWADAIFLRRRASDIGLGPYLQLSTTGFSSVDAGLGATWVIPTKSVALAVSGGAYVRGASLSLYPDKVPGAWSWTPGLSGSIFLGSKSYNFHGPYAMTIGAVVQGKYGISSEALRRHAELTLALQIDFEVLALPFLLVGQALGGPSGH
jgi:hypothetical protein